MKFGALLGAVVAAAAGCQGADRPGNVSRPRDAGPAPTVADSLVLPLPNGVSVWLAEGRQAKDSSGRTCFERSVEIRTAASRIKVPLLFVRLAPSALDANHLRAELSRDCRVMAIYSVEIATGRPSKLEDR